MLKDITRPKRKVFVEYELVFDDGANNGFGFPCDAAGNPLPGLMPEAIENLEWAKRHPEKFVRFNEVVEFRRFRTEPGHGTCSCGAEVTLEDVYYGACPCENCGRWYNLFGQELLEPEYWETDPSDDEYGWEPNPLDEY